MHPIASFCATARSRCAPRNAAVYVVALAGLFVCAPIASAQVEDIYFANTVSYTIDGRVGATGVGATQVDATDFQQTLNRTSSPVALDFGIERSALGTGGGALGHVKVNVAASANHGRLGVLYKGDVDANTSGTLKSAYGIVDQTFIQARWQDTLYFHGNVSGRQTTIKATLPLTGSISGGATSTGAERAYSESGLRIKATGNGTIIIPFPAPTGFGSIWALETLNAVPGGEPPTRHFAPPTSVTATMIFTEGHLYELDYSLEIQGSAWALINLASTPRAAHADWDADFSHTLMWGGITSVTDTLTGLPIENYTLTSASGIDYTVAMPEPLLGDFNNDAVVNAGDIDLLCEAIESNSQDTLFDVNGSGTVDDADLAHQVEVILATKFGDTDTDGDVDLADLGNLATGFGVLGEKRWGLGNFDCDTDVDLNDLGTLATNFEGGRAAAFAAFEASIPEPASAAVLALAAAAFAARHRRV